MALKISQDSEQDNKLNENSSGVNKKYVGSADKADTSDDSNVKVQNQIHNLFISFVKSQKTMTDAYFRSTLMCVYSDIYKKGLVFKNIPDDAEIQANIKKINDDVSFSRTYSILNYYAKEGDKDIIDGENMMSVTAMFYSSLHFFIKREFADV